MLITIAYAILALLIISYGGSFGPAGMAKTVKFYPRLMQVWGKKDRVYKERSDLE